MDNLNDPNAPPPATVWPPVPEQGAGVWPPAPTEIPRQTYPFKTLLLRVTGSVPDFRTGVIGVDANEVTIEGAAVRPYEIQVPILIASYLVCFLIGYIIMEYVARIQARVQIPWASITSIVVVPKKRQVCIVYTAANYKGIVKPYSLATKLTQQEYDAMTAQCQSIAPEKVVEGKMKSWNSPAVILFLIGILLNIIYYVSVFAIGHAHR